MFWWFERLGRFVRCETAGLPGGGYELKIVHEDGSERIERFPDSANLARRQQAVEQQLRLDGWSGPHGWNV